MRKSHKKKPTPRRKQDRKVKKVEKHFCKGEHPGFTFTKTDKGVKRQCTDCDFCVTEIGRIVTITPVKDFHPVKRRYQTKKMRLANG